MQNIVLAYYMDDILLIRPEVQEVVSVSPLGETYTLLRVGDKKTHKYSEAYQIHKIFRGPVVRGMLRHSL